MFLSNSRPDRARGGEAGLDRNNKAAAVVRRGLDGVRRVKV